MNQPSFVRQIRRKEERRCANLPGCFLLGAATVNPPQTEAVAASKWLPTASARAPSASHAQLLHRFLLATENFEVLNYVDPLGASF